MTVELIAITQPVNKQVPNFGRINPLVVTEKAASVCYDSQPTEDFKITKSCHQSGHDSILEHISFTFHIKDVSRALLAQLSRHRHISLTVRSTRYCNEKNFSYLTPKDMDFLEYHELMDTINNLYSSSVTSNVLKEQARMALPMSLYTELYLTANARALIEIANLRLCTKAEQEIRSLFEHIKQEVSYYCPEVASWMVPKCEVHELPFCTEKKSCGRHKKLSVVLKEYTDEIEKLNIKIDNLHEDAKNTEEFISDILDVDVDTGLEENDSF